MSHIYACLQQIQRTHDIDVVHFERVGVRYKADRGEMYDMRGSKLVNYASAGLNRCDVERKFAQARGPENGACNFVASAEQLVTYVSTCKPMHTSDESMTH